MSKFIKYISPNRVTASKNKASQQLEDDVVDFIVNGGVINVYDSAGRLIYSHVDV